MPATAKRTFSLPAEQAEFIDALVASGSYSTGSEVIRAGLRALRERDAAVERWLLQEAATSYDRWKANPAATLTSDELAERMNRRHQARRKSAV